MNTRARNQFAASFSHVPDSPPREPRDLGALALWPSIKPILLLALFFCSLLFFIPFVIMAADKDIQAQRRALKTATGTILEIKELSNPPQSNANFPSRTNIKFSFRAPGGTTFYGNQIVTGDSPFALLKNGAPLPVIYDPQEPSFNGVAGVLGSNTMPISVLFALPFFGLFYVAMFGWPLLKPLRQTLQARRVYRTGEMAVGHVDFVGRKSGLFHAMGYFRPPVEVLFHFQDAEGQTHRARQTCDNDWLLHKLNVGSELQVAYLPDKPERSIFLENFIA